MGKIIILDENTANKIAAGEVIERPASVIKELVENSIDAGSTTISVEIRNGGISFIRVIDNGSGIAEDDAEIAFERHATSKIRRADDLESISSMGFRGEALASIAAVSTVQVSTRVASSVQGITIEVKGGCVMDFKPAGCPVGTSITVRELFFNTPARYKFLKKDSTEAGYVADMLSRIALGYPDISFKLVSNGTVLLYTPGNGDLKSAIFSVYGAETSKQLLEVHTDDGHVQITGYIGKAELSRANRTQQSFYINRRYIRSKTISAALDAAYSTFLMKNRFPFALLNIYVNQTMVDVNVHPTKMEVKFSNEQEIYRAVYHAVNSALLSRSSIRTLPSSEKGDKTAYNIRERQHEKPVLTQQSFGWMKEELDRKREQAVRSGDELVAERGLEYTPLQKSGEPHESSYSRDTEQMTIESHESADVAFRAEERCTESVPESDCSGGPDFRTTDNDVPFGERIGGADSIEDSCGARTMDSSGAAESITDTCGVTDSTAVSNSATESAKDSNGRVDSIPDSSSRLENTPDSNGATAFFHLEDTEDTTEFPSRDIPTEPDFPDLSEGARIIGQAFSTYILLERGDELFLVDQHAAHERIRYEELKQAYSRKEPLSQTLLAVMPVELSVGEYQFAVAEAAFFENLGFQYEPFGTNAIILRAVPYQENEADIRTLFLEVLDFVMNAGAGEKKLIADETLYTIACKSAVKAHKKLDDREITALLNRLASLENPYTCPHGRPSILRLRRIELEKLFKRIV